MNKTAEEILSKYTGQEGLYLRKGMVSGSDALEAMIAFATSQQTSFAIKVLEEIVHDVIYKGNIKRALFLKIKELKNNGK